MFEELACASADMMRASLTDVGRFDNVGKFEIVGELVGLFDGGLDGDEDNEGDADGIVVGCGDIVGCAVVGSFVGLIVPHRVDPDVSTLLAHASSFIQL